MSLYCTDVLVQLYIQTSHMLKNQALMTYFVDFQRGVLLFEKLFQK
jgi:hypothetical protein